VSRAHAAVRRGRGGWWLLDLGSRLGTTLNGRPVTDGTRLRAGDVVCCGTAVLLADRPAAVLDVATAASEATAGFWDRQAARSGAVALR
jgi:predicted component of type VI protein secretion system